MIWGFFNSYVALIAKKSRSGGFERLYTSNAELRTVSSGEPRFCVRSLSLREAANHVAILRLAECLQSFRGYVA